jgi:hypothetical protein
MCWIVASMAATTFAGDTGAKIQVKLIYGTSAEDQSNEPELQEMGAMFKADFGFKHYKLLGEKAAKLKEGESDTLDLGHQFEVRLKNKATKKPYHVIDINLFHKGGWLCYFEASVAAKGEPVVIKGPWTKQGLVIIVLTAK